MHDLDHAHRAALARHHRRKVLTGLPATVGVTWLVWGPWVRDAWKARDPWDLGAFGLAISSATLTAISNYRRADLAAAEDLARHDRQRRREARVAEQRARGETPTIEVFPPGTLAPGIRIAFVVWTTGLAGALWNYLRRPDRARPRSGPPWRWRPGPAWWTAWSWQNLPVNGASLAPRATQIAYQRRQLLVLQTTGILGSAVALVAGRLHPPTPGREPPRLADGLLKLTSTIVTLVLGYRRMPRKVDDQRARRREHDTAVAALRRARATGRPDPANPWRHEILMTATAVVMTVGGMLAQLRLLRRAPTRDPTV